MIATFKKQKLNIFQRFSLLVIPGLFSLSTTLVSCSVETSKAENSNSGIKTKVVHMGYQSAGDIVRLKGVIEKRLQPLGVSVEWAQFAAGPQLMEAMNVGTYGLGKDFDFLLM